MAEFLPIGIKEKLLNRGIITLKNGIVLRDRNKCESFVKAVEPFVKNTAFLMYVVSFKEKHEHYLITLRTDKERREYLQKERDKLHAELNQYNLKNFYSRQDIVRKVESESPVITYNDYLMFLNDTDELTEKYLSNSNFVAEWIRIKGRLELLKYIDRKISNSNKTGGDNHSIKQYFEDLYKGVWNKDTIKIENSCEDIYLHLKTNHNLDWQVHGLMYHLLDRPTRNEYFKRKNEKEGNDISVSHLMANERPGLIRLLDENNISLQSEVVENLIFYYNDIKYDFYGEDATSYLFEVQKFTPNSFLRNRNINIPVSYSGNPIISEQKIMLLHEAFKKVWPNKEIESLAAFKSRFILNSNPENPFIPPPKSGHGRDEYTTARQYLFAMLHLLNANVKEITNIDKFSKDQFGKAKSKMNYSYPTLPYDIKNPVKYIFQ